MSKKLPAIQFYIRDWLLDPVSGCSLAAQGLWLRLIILMHDCSEYGRLTMKGKPIPREIIARRCGSTPAEFEKLFSELDFVGVPDVGDDGAISCRRMVRDAELRSKNANRMREYRQSATHVTPSVTHPVTHPVTEMCLNASTSTSTSTSTSSSRMEYPSLETVKAKAGMIGCKPEWAEDFFDHYETQGWKKANGQPLTNWAIALKRWAEKNRNGKAEGKPSNGKASTSSQAYVLDQREKGLKEELANLQQYRGETATDTLWDHPKYKARWFEAKRELKQIAEQRRQLA